MAIVIHSFPKILIDIAKCYNEEINSIDLALKYILVTKNRRLAIESIPAKEFQVLLKNALGRIENTNFRVKLKIEEFDATNILTFRKHCRNAKLRNIYFRLIHNDFFTHERMNRYKMTNTDECPRCNQTETTKHLLWECHHSKHIWDLYNDYMIKLDKANSVISEYSQIYKAGETAGITIIKAKIIQEMIQIRRPTNWDTLNLEKVVDELVNIELYNYKKKHCLAQFNTKWKFLKR